MNTDIFNNRITSNQFAKAVTKQLETIDDLSAFLVFHLSCEYLIESFIYNVCGIEEFLYNQSKRKNIIMFNAKLEIAENLGLPIELKKAIGKFNALRNNISHSLEDVDIEKSINEAITFLDQYPKENKPIADFEVEIEPETTNSKKILFNNLPMPFKLLTLNAIISKKMLSALENK
ncbi:hypothetical protein LVJ82_17100 [Vitreoscilla massiliensis]|uniref:DUF4145 domain-containing protein n=1 Tax=Vitreoscilla massiliensis TaxID=1689272 RepID=A0ABY4E031_9NEIS|nr:hypothetical protein [Vitreoscilla massiliensis]UOO89137.1 hypothetical protein LVJ82_17100 [Vitreoscilla massiliensis]